MTMKTDSPKASEASLGPLSQSSSPAPILPKIRSYTYKLGSTAIQYDLTLPRNASRHLRRYHLSCIRSASSTLLRHGKIGLESVRQIEVNTGSVPGRGRKRDRKMMTRITRGWEVEMLKKGDVVRVVIHREGGGKREVVTWKL